MKCTNCGAEIMIGTSFCSRCGAQVLTTANINYQDMKQEMDKPAKKKDSMLALTCGLAGLILSLPVISFFTLICPGLLLDILGIVFGSGSNKDEKAKAGKVMGIIGLAVLGVSIIIYIIIAMGAVIEGNLIYEENKPWYEEVFEESESKPWYE